MQLAQGLENDRLLKPNVQTGIRAIPLAFIQEVHIAHTQWTVGLRLTPFLAI